MPVATQPRGQRTLRSQAQRMVTMQRWLLRLLCQLRLLLMMLMLLMQ